MTYDSTNAEVLLNDPACLTSLSSAIKDAIAIAKSPIILSNPFKRAELRGVLEVCADFVNAIQLEKGENP